MIETLSYIRDCRKYINTVRICFPGVHDLVYQLPKKLAMSVSNADSNVNSDRKSDGNNSNRSSIKNAAATNINTQFNLDIYGILFEKINFFKS